jgi:hypothetical protein
LDESEIARYRGVVLGGAEGLSMDWFQGIQIDDGYGAGRPEAHDADVGQIRGDMNAGNLVLLAGVFFFDSL